MSSPNVLLDLAAALAHGEMRVVDLTMPLGPETPVLPLPRRSRTPRCSK